MDVIFVSLITFGIYAILIVLMRSRRGRCWSTTDLSGKTAIVTGASRGIGFHVALDLATRNANVIVASRAGPQAVDAVERIRQQTGNRKVRHVEVDLTCLESVRRFSDVIHREEDRLDILVNNAGVSNKPKQITKDGLELNMATNHFGPFLLTNLLLDLLKKSAPSRIIVTSSIVYSWGNIDFNNLNAEKSLDIKTIYLDTKLANILFAQELSRQLKSTGVTVNSLHPGSVQTDLLESLPAVALYIFKVISRLFFRTPEEGAQTSIYLAVSPEVQGVTGEYFSECKRNRLSDKALDVGVARKLWEVSEKLTGLA